MNKVLMQVEKAINAEIKHYHALQFQINYLKSTLNIEKLKPAHGFLRQKQEESLVLAKNIIEAFTTKNIIPMLSGHSLLGAVRHKGFIPWESNMQFALMAYDFWRIEDCIKEEIKSQNPLNFQWVESKHTKKKITNDPLNYEKNILEKNILEKEKNALHTQKEDFKKAQEDELTERILKMEQEIEASALTKFQYDPFDYFTTLNDCMQAYNAKKQSKEKTPIFVLRTPYSISFYQGIHIEEAVRVQFVPYYFHEKEMENQELETQTELIQALIHKSITYGMVFHFYEELLKNMPRNNKNTIDMNNAHLTDQYIYAGINNHEFIRKNLNFQNPKEEGQKVNHSPHFYHSTDFFPLKSIAFEGHMFQTLNNTNAYLSSVYGDYQALPKYLGVSPYYVNLNVWLRDNKKRLLTISEATLI